MPRRTRNQNKQGEIQSLFTELNRLRNSPLGPIFSQLQQGLAFIQQAFNAGGCSQAQFEVVISQTRSVFQLLPQEFTDRFWFDLQMIQAVKESWNAEKQSLSHYLIPVNDDEWAHRGAYIPVGNQYGQRVSINVIHFPGDSNINSIDLLDYPFLCHELAHNLYFFDDSFFREHFDDKLKSFLNKLRLQSISDHGAAKTLSERIRQGIKAYWQPTANHQNWAHELAMDLTGLWTCGPAYLSAILYELDEDQINPFLLTQEHPPYAVRIEALILACGQLGWEQEAIRLKRISHKWRRSKHGEQIDNRYIALANPDLITNCVQCVLATCQYHNLPKCDKQTLLRIGQKLSDKETLGWGTELILGAYLKYKADEAIDL